MFQFVSKMISGEAHFSKLIRSVKPVLNNGEFVFCSFAEVGDINLNETVCFFREKEGVSVILPKKVADERQLKYSFIASWITLMVHSSLEAVGLTAAVSKALADENISCNVVAGYYHDHIFVARKDTERAIRILEAVSNGSSRRL
jgi:hypothetical protein